MFGALVVGLVLALPGLAAADQNDPRLDSLFGALKRESDPVKIHLLEAQIWTTWLETDSPTVELLLRQGLEAMSLNRFEKSLEHLNSVVELAPDFAEGWNKRATVLFLMGRYPQSLADVDKTLALEPRHFGALSGLGLISNALGADKEALDAFERALEVNPHLRHARAEVERLKKKIKGERI